MSKVNEAEKVNNKAGYRDINDIMERRLKPRLAPECQRLGIPEV